MYHKEEVHSGMRVYNKEKLMIWCQGRLHREVMLHLRQKKMSFHESSGKPFHTLNSMSNYIEVINKCVCVFGDRTQTSMGGERK